MNNEDKFLLLKGFLSIVELIVDIILIVMFSIMFYRVKELYKLTQVEIPETKVESIGSPIEIEPEPATFEVEPMDTSEADLLADDYLTLNADVLAPVVFVYPGGVLEYTVHPDNYATMGEYLTALGADLKVNDRGDSALYSLFDYESNDSCMWYLHIYPKNSEEFPSYYVRDFDDVLLTSDYSYVWIYGGI